MYLGLDFLIIIFTSATDNKIHGAYNCMIFIELSASEEEKNGRAKIKKGMKEEETK